MANSALVRLLGFKSLKELSNRNLKNEGYEKGYSRSEFQKLIKLNGQVIGLETCWTKKDGSVIFVRESAKAIRDKNNKIIFYDGTVEDISEQKRLLDKLRENEDRYRDLVENSFDFICTHDFDGKILTSNNSAARILGHSPEAILRMRIQDIVAPEYRPRMEDYFTTLRKKGKANGLMIVRTKNGEIRIWEYNNTVRFEGVDKPVVRGMAHDITERILAERALRASEKKYRQIVETAQEGIWIIDAENKTTFVNKKMAEMLGYSVTEMIGKILFDFMDDEGKIIAEQNIQRRKKGIAEQHDFKFLKKDKTDLWTLLEANPIYDEKGNYQGSLGMVTDISQRREAEEKVRTNLHFMNVLIDTIPNPVFYKDVNGIYLGCNKTFAEKIIGRPVEKIIGKNLNELSDSVLSEYSPLYSRKESELFQNPGIQVYESKVKCADGSERDFIFNKATFTDSCNKVVGLVGIMTDITDYNKTERSLRESEELFRTLAETTSTAIFVYQGDKFVFSNHAAQKIAGYSEEDLLAKKFWDFVHPDFRQLIKDRGLARQLGEKVPNNYEFKIICKDGSEKWLDFTAGSINWKGKTSAIGTAFDITDRKKAESANLKLNRIYALISQINQMIVRASEREKIFQDACSIAVKYGKFRMAWIGLVDEQSGTLQPVAYDGAEDNYLSQNTVSIKNVDEGKGPSGTAVREGRHIVCNDIANDPRMEPWREEALKRNYFSSIALPLFVENQVIGAFNIYASESNFFDTEEVNLLIEVSQDISYALDSLLKETKRKQAESNLRLFRTLIDHSNDAIELIDPETLYFIDANHKAFTDLGYTKEQFLTMTPYDIDPVITAASMQKLMENLINSGSLIMESVHKRKDGSNFPVELNLKFVRLDRNYIINVVRDISVRKQEEQILRESEEKYRSIFNNAPVGIYQSDRAGRFLSVNQRLVQILGYESKEELMNKFINDDIYFDQGAREQLIAKFEPVGFVADFEVRWKKKDGTPIWIQLTSCAVKDSSGRTLLFDGFVRDISDRKNSEIEIKKLSDAVAQSPASIMITDLKGNIEYVNKTFEIITGYTLSEVRSKNPRFLTSGIISKNEYRVLWETISSGKIWRGEFRNKKKNGDLYWEDALISPVKDNEGNIINYLAVNQDISAKKKMIEELFTAKEEAEKADNLKSEFLAQMSHEIRSPLNVVISLSDLIKEEFSGSLSNEQRIYFEGIDSAGKRIIRTIDMILNAAQLQVGTFHPVFKTIDLYKDVFENIAKEFYQISREKGIKLTIDCTIPSPLVHGDHLSVNQIFVNLVDNALKYTNDGSVSVLISENENGFVFVSLEDTGIGISPEYMKMIFKPFTQEDRGYSRKFEGNGLGLSLVKKYCDLNNATITVESEKGKGSKFTVTFNTKVN
ncbi:MAG: hypothetical protein CVV24_10885 [Ignavibacteriae bacterium HGW-Ignavibacteriae-3]|nr:MAG: hypothetical protein CVV24_10885 [Ignavibacteriae bacterium HGW-Ignavibacteriae-3]